MTVARHILTPRAQHLAGAVHAATEASPNEQSLRHEIEKELEKACSELRIPWTPYRLDKTLRNPEGAIRFVDVSHGAVVIEYEPPKCFRGRAAAELNHAQSQCIEYAAAISVEEGRELGEYVMAAWDGAHISFGSFDRVTGTPSWEPLIPFDVHAAERLLSALDVNGRPLVSPAVLSSVVGPESAFGQQLIPKFFAAIRKAESKRTSRAKLLYTEWKRIFGQVVGIPTERLAAYLVQVGAAHGANYSRDSSAYLFALNTYIALIAKLTAALSLRVVSRSILDKSTPLADRLKQLEDGYLFQQAGVSNLLNGDFFSWYTSDAQLPHFVNSIEGVLTALSGVDFDVARKNLGTVRDLFKGMYMAFVPRALRHALGEYYTPDWLAEHALNVLAYKPSESLIDPNCGTGTFILEALRRRLNDPAYLGATPAVLLNGLWGLDLNPLAVLSARVSLVVVLSAKLSPGQPVRLPIFLADAIQTAQSDASRMQHVLLTEYDKQLFSLPPVLVSHPQFFDIFATLRDLLEDDYSPVDILASLRDEYHLHSLSEPSIEMFLQTIKTLHNLHAKKWNGIWSAIIAERFAATAIGTCDVVAGNPPWVKWSHLPSEYAAFIKPRCEELGVFSEDSWVGGIESDISTVITYEALNRWVRPQGRLGFFITGTVFVNESSQGFRRFKLNDGIAVKVERVEDYGAIKPFEDVSNFPTFLHVTRGAQTTYPVLYRKWAFNSSPTRVSVIGVTSAAQFTTLCAPQDLAAMPVPGTDAGPWLVGTPAELSKWRTLFGSQSPAYVARKGVTTDLNGLFFVEVEPVNQTTVRITNNPALGRKAIPRRSADVEDTHIFPLIRGRCVSRFHVATDPNYCVIVPQRGMHGDAQLPSTSPKLYKFLKQYSTLLKARASLRKFQPNDPYWSLWSTGPYTFSKFKVIWQEMSGGNFVSGYIGEIDHPVLGKRNPVPDHKVYFVPLSSEDEAAYLCGLLNARTVARAISAYAAALSLGTSVVEYLKIPKFDPNNQIHLTISSLSRSISLRRGQSTLAEENALDSAAISLF